MSILPEQIPDGKCSPLVGLTEEAMLGRVVMLKRMRRLLIVDWHPVIDVLLADYESDIKRMGLLREPLDPDDDVDPDCLDRDLE